jgi:antitoxin CptB
LAFGRIAAMTGTTRTSDGLDHRRRKLLFRAWHRGIREMDLIMGRFADSHIDSLSAAELDEFEVLMQVPDQQLYAWVNGSEPVPAERDTPLLRQLRTFRGDGAR